MIPIASGTFTMGSPMTEPERRKFEGPQPGVVIQSFAISDAEITRAQYAVFVADTKRDTTGCFTYGFSSFRDDTAIDTNASWRNPGFEQTSEHPAVCVSWQDAKDYAAWLAQKTGRPYRLPSEAEWEYAARAGTNTTFFWGVDEELACHYANGGDPTLLRALPQLHEEIAFALREGDAGARFVECNDAHAFTAPTRSYRPNPFGLYDMIGNAWEYVEDCWYESMPTDGRARTEGPCEFHRGRGGSWDDFPEELRSARRSRIKPDARRNDTGFRVAITIAAHGRTAGVSMFNPLARSIRNSSISTYSGAPKSKG
jgi:formylglycine-generating enzyme required for sulfatase activity